MRKKIIIGIQKILKPNPWCNRYNQYNKCIFNLYESIKIYVLKRIVEDEFDEQVLYFVFDVDLVGINFILMPMMTKYKGQYCHGEPTTYKKECF